MYKEDIIRLESIQRKATKLLPELSQLSYADRLRALELPSLYYRRLRTDIIFIYNYTHQNIILNTSTHCTVCRNNNSMLAPCTTGTRGHPFRYMIQQHNTIRKTFITSKVLHQWNSLSTHTATACSTDSFKGRLRDDASMQGSIFYIRNLQIPPPLSRFYKLPPSTCFRNRTAQFFTH